MRAAYVCFDSGVPIFGRKGSAIHVQEVLRALSRAGVGVELFASRVDGTAPRDLAGIRVHGIPTARHRDAAEREREALAADRCVAKTLDQAGPFDFVYERYSLWTAAAMEFATRRGIPGILEVNAPLIEEQIAYRQLVNRSAAEHWTAKAFTEAAAVVAVSRDIADYVAGVRGSRNEVHVVPNGVDLSRFPADARPNRPAPDLFTIGFLGSLKPWHGLLSVVDALTILARRDSRVRLLVVGDGPERAPLEAALASRGLAPLAEFTGAVDPASVAGWLASMDAAVVPYSAEGAAYFSPLKLFEYMAAGLPIVASAIGQVREVIADNVTGLLCQPGDAAALAETLERLRADASLRRRLGTAARAHVVANHTWDHVARQILDIAMSCGGGTVEKAG